MPEVGHYNFTVYAALIDTDASTPGNVLPHNQGLTPANTLLSVLNQDTKAVLSFRLQCSKLVHFEIPPNHATEINVFGSNLIMKRLGLFCCDFKQGVLGTDRDGKLNLVFEMIQPLDVEAYLYSTDLSISTKCLELCMLKRIVHNFLIIIINPPHAGLYGLDIHAAPKGTSNTILGSQLPRFPWRGFYHLALMANDDLFPTKPDEIVYNYLIRVQDPSIEVEPFPHICNPILWKNCCLIAPKNYRLNSYDVHFSIIVPKTSQVQVSSGDRVLEKLEPREIENSWVGLVSINDHFKYIYIEAEFNNKFKKLIKFKGTGSYTKD